MTHTVACVPLITLRALLDVASTLAFLRIPVVGVVEASLRNAVVRAGRQVPGHWSFNWISDWALEGADAFSELSIPYIILSVTNWNLS